MKKEELKKLLDTYDDLYYNQDISEISDEEYNIIKEKYLFLTGEDEYNYVPGEASKNSKKYTHTSNISSLDKAQITDVDNLKLEIKRLWPVVIQEKMDGLTLVSYPDGEDVTRGNGQIGEIVTENAKKVAGIGIRPLVPVRSEVVMLISEFKRINEKRILAGLEPHKNPRNAAAGMLRQKDSSKVEGLKAFAYNTIINTAESADEINNNADQIRNLRDACNWNTVTSYTPETEEDALNYILTFDRSVLDYEIDGLVIKHNGDKKFGYTGHHPKGAIAVKFKAQGVWTTIKGITWQVGRTGKITPVANFNTIQILGSDVSKATLHNMGIITALGLDNLYSIGKHNNVTEVFVIKANDVIPAIVEVKNPDLNSENLYVNQIFEPKNCPICGSVVEKINDQIFCMNDSCQSKIYKRLEHLAKLDAFNIEALSEKTAEKLVDMYTYEMNKLIKETSDKEKIKNLTHKIKNLHPSFIYELSLDNIKSLEGFADKSSNNLYNAIQKSKVIDFDKFLYGCGMPLIGRRISKDIAIHYSKTGINPSIMMGREYPIKFASLREVEGIGEETINSLVANFEEMVVPFGFYNLTYIPMKIIKKAVNQLSIVITGEFDISRKEITELITDKGHKVSGSVSKKTNYLLAAPGEEGTGKYKKATELNTLIINSIEELKELL